MFVLVCAFAGNALASDALPVGIYISYGEINQYVNVMQASTAYLWKVGSGYSSPGCSITGWYSQGSLTFTNTASGAVSAPITCVQDFSMVGSASDNSSALTVSVIGVDYGWAGLPLSQVRQAMLYGSAIAGGVLFVGQLWRMAIGGLFAQAKRFAN